MTKAIVILPKRKVFDAAKMRGVIVSTLNGTAKAIKVDFDVTTQTWDHRPDFRISSPSEYTREVSTDDDVYAMLEKGTKKHDIRPKKPRGILRFNTPFRAKTVPNAIRSNKGSKGNTPVVARIVHHPGTKPRLWTKAIKKKWDQQIGITFQRAIDAAAS
jgi:hypothetical protein